MIQLHSAKKKHCPPSVIAVAVNRDPARQHTGVVFRRSAGGVVFCDVQYDHKLGVRKLPQDYFWTPVDLEPQEVDQVAEFIELVIENFKTDPPPYSFVYVRNAFDATGKLNDNAGITCATFVVGIFEALAIPILDTTTWTKRAEDETFRLSFMTSGGATGSGWRRLADESPAFRIKPYEVCGAAANGNYPVVMPTAVQRASEVEAIVASTR